MENSEELIDDPVYPVATKLELVAENPERESIEALPEAVAHGSIELPEGV